MIYVLCVPHRYEPSVWTASDWQDYERRCLESFSDGQDQEFFEKTHDLSEWDPDEELISPPEIPMTDDARRGLIMEIDGSDLSFYQVCDGPEEARWLVQHLRETQPRIGVYGPLAAAAELEKALTDA